MDDLDNTSSSSKTGILSRATTLLELVATHVDGVGVRDAARRTGIDRSAVSRILTHLEEIGYVEQQNDRGVYVAGPRLFSLVASLAERDSVTKAARPFLKDLVHRFNETCYVATRLDDGLIFRSKVDCEHRIRYVIEMGKQFPLVSGAAGAAILSGLTEEELAPVLDQPIIISTKSSFTSADEIRAQLKIDRELGYTYSPGRWVPNGAGISAPFFDAGGRCVGSITLSCPMDRLVQMSVEEIGTAVSQAARDLSVRLGFVPESAN